MRDFLLTFRQICLCNGDEFFWQHDSVSAAVNDLSTEKCLSVVTLDTRANTELIPATLRSHVYLNSVQQMVSGELAGEGLQAGFSRHGLPPQRAPLDTAYPLREHLNSVQRMVSGGHCEGLFPDTSAGHG